MDGTIDRFKGAEYMPLLRALNLTVIGQGGIGSPFCFTTSRALSGSEARMFAYEYDTVEVQNLGGQVFSIEDIGTPKAEATQKRLKLYSDYERFLPLGKFEEDSMLTPTLMMCVDHNPTRYMSHHLWVEQSKNMGWKQKVVCGDDEYEVPCFYLDGRLAFNQFQIFCVTEHTYKAHEAHHLHKENNSLMVPGCTTQYNPEQGFLVGNFMFTWYRNFIQNVVDMHQGFPATKWCPYMWSFNLSTGKQSQHGEFANFK